MATHCAGMYAAVTLHLIIRALNCLLGGTLEVQIFDLLCLRCLILNFYWGWWMNLSIRRSILERGTKALLQYLTDKIPA